jgi:HD-like signal output (HDOD) protein
VGSGLWDFGGWGFEMVETKIETTLADRTLARIQAGLRDNQTVCLARVVELIREITTRPDTISVQHLEELIERDVAVVAEILRVANTIGYNPEGVEVETVGQAIQTIGFMKIRNLAVSLLLLRHAGEVGQVQESREVSVMAVLCGQLAEVASERLGLVESGHAFVCVALRHYGELLVSTFLAEDYREVRRRLVAGEGDRVWAEVFGATPMELGRRVLAGMRLPEVILGTLEELPGVVKVKYLPQAQAGLVVATDLSVRVSRWVAGAFVVPGGMEGMARSLQTDYGSMIDLGKGDLQEMFVEVDRRLSSLGAVVGKVPLLGRIREVARGRLPVPVQGAAGRPMDVEEKDFATDAVESVVMADPGKVLMEAIADLTDLLGVSPVKGMQVFSLGARRVMEALGLVDCWVFRRHGAAGELQPFVGAGALFPQLSVKSRICLEEKTVFSLSIQRGEAVILERPKDAGIQAFVPAWLTQVSGGSPLMILPVGRAVDVSAVLVGVGEEGQLQELAPQVRQQLQVMAKLMVLARDA